MQVGNLYIRRARFRDAVVTLVIWEALGPIGNTVALSPYQKKTA